MTDMHDTQHEHAADGPRLARVERLLRARGAAQLSPGFKRGVMESIAKLPAPQTLAPLSAPRGGLALLRSLGAFELAGGALLLLAAVVPFIPGAGDWLATADYSLRTAELTLTLGDTTLSASLLSVAAGGCVAGLLAACGVCNARYRLLAG